MSQAPGIAMGLVEGWAEGESAKTMAGYNSRIANLNANTLDLQATRTLNLGDEQATDFSKQVKKTVGSQRAALAAQGVEVNDGSAMEVQEETYVLGAKDAQTIRNNAFLEAMGMKAQASSLRLQADFEKKAAKTKAANSILAGGLKGYAMSGGFSPGNATSVSTPINPFAGAGPLKSYANK